LIVAARQRAVQAVNTSLIELYWHVGQTISRKVAQAECFDLVFDLSSIWSDQGKVLKPKG